MEKLERKISLYGLTMIAAGSCIGSGIFRSPSETASYLPYDSWLLVAWIVGGLIALAGALSLAELGAMYPQAGGVYVYLRKVYGDAAAFLYGWVSMIIIISGSLAALAIVFSSYVGSVISISEEGKLLLSIATIIVLSVLNIYGVKLGNIFSSIITTLKITGIIAIIVIGISMGHESLHFNFIYNGFVSAKDSDMGFSNAFGLACVGIFFSYGGFQHASFMAGEVKDVKRTLPRAMILGTLIVIVVYITINIAYLKLLPIAQIAKTDRVANAALSTVLSSGSIFIAILIAVSVLGTISIYCMSAPRIYYALAEDGLFFKQLAAIHPKYKTPTNAIIAQGIITCIILLIGRSFEKVISYTIFVDYIFLALAVLE